MDPKTLETWLRLTADALRGAEEARKALSALAEGPLSSDHVSRWMSLWMPQTRDAEGARPAPAEFQGAIEEWWKAIGVVPRHRYLDLLEKYHELAKRMEEAEATIRRLRDLLSSKGQESEAAGVLDAWEEMTRKALEAQAEWARGWTEGLAATKADSKKK